ncbi:N-acetyltransferase B complex non catalytic subunit-domain-containing protein [Gorgonomyces haynaldii]|nr:N-acetyltransferase B complex non catalytic subunit-domain-containing protein [Gorgonomyces haynaldii]
MQVERILRPIYDALDYQNYKQVLQLCNKALKKGPMMIVLALKALALARLGLIDESYDILVQLKNAKPTQLAILQTMASALKALSLMEEIVEIYANAVELVPGDEDLANHHFIAICKLGDFKLLQQASMKLTKQFKLPKYYMWTVVSIYMQALDPNASNRSVLFPLAERMIDKAHKENYIQTFEGLLLYLDILKSQQKYKEALLVLQGPLQKLCKVENDLDHLLIALLEQIEDHQNVFEKSLGLIKRNPDDWKAHVSLIESSLKIGQSSQVAETLKSLETSDKRGPHLALIKLCHCLGDFDRMTDCISEYVKKFGTMLICFEDVMPYLSDCHPKILDLQSLVQPCDTIRNTRLNLTISKIQFHLSEPDHKQYLERYQETIPLGLKLDERERQYGDDYLLLAVYVLLRNTTLQNILESIAILEYGLERSKFNFSFTILLVRLYIQLGAVGRAHTLYQKLDVKQVQLDSVSFVMSEDLELFGDYNKALLVFREALHVYDRNEIETPEMIAQAFRFDTYSKVPEFVDFRDRVRHSIQRSVFQRQLIRVDLVSQFSDLKEVVQYLNDLDITDLQLLDPSKLFDNRDTKLLSTFAPYPNIKQIPLERNNWLNLHGVIPLLLQKLLGSPKTGRNLEQELEQVVGDHLGGHFLLQFSKIFASLEFNGLQPLFDKLHSQIDAFKPLEAHCLVYEDFDQITLIVEVSLLTLGSQLQLLVSLETRHTAVPVKEATQGTSNSRVRSANQRLDIQIQAQTRTSWTGPQQSLIQSTTRHCQAPH